MVYKKFLLSSISILIFSLFAIHAHAQNLQNNYESHWKNVETSEKKGLTRTALQEVNVIYNLAVKDKNSPQIIKSLLYKNKLLTNIQEDALPKIIDSMQQEILIASQPAKSILENIVAQLYENYFQQNRYRLYGVTNTENFQKDDIATWSISDFQNKISELYLASLSDSSLKNISLATYDAVIEKGNVRYLRPTLFDFLAHRALDYFESAENDVNRPSYSFEIDNPMAFAPAGKFIDMSFSSPDSSSLHQRALKILQELIRMHLHDIKPLTDVNLERLQFVYQYSVLPGKDSLYANALQHIYESSDDPSVAQAGFMWGQLLMKDNENRDTEAKNLKAAISVLQNVTKKFPGSEGGINSLNLIATIQHPALSLQTEKVNVTDKPFRALVTFKNIDNIYLRMIPISKAQKEKFRELNSNEKRFSLITSTVPVKQWQQALPQMDDYLLHSAEIKIDGLPVGEYMLIASNAKDFNTGKNVMAAQFVYISNISFINNGTNYFILDRETGRPLPNASVKFWNRRYDSKKRAYTLDRSTAITTDKNGFFKIPENLNKTYSGNIRLEINYKKDHLFLDDEQYLYSYNPYRPEAEEYDDQQEYDEAHARVFYFTDRSIYRPGQLVYYKGIGVTKDVKTKKTMLLEAGQRITVFLFNANGEKIDSANVSLNDYGSFNGKFELPSNQLTGNFHIAADKFNGSSYFSMEEYKRPKFYAEFDKAASAYRINDTVKIIGHANAYAGNHIDGAKVTYRVTRVARFLYPWYFWRKGFPVVQPLEITHGETVTDAKGEFTVSFAAIPDKTLDPKTDPVFDYRVAADVTDINGETRSAEIVVPVGYKALDLQIQLADKGTFLKDSLRSFTITSKNLSGEPQDVKATLKVFKLQSPKRLLRNRLWPEPDTSVMSMATYISYFPHDIYKDENRPETWERKELAFDRTDSINGNKSLAINSSLSSGWYTAEATAKDRYGNEVKDIKYFRVINPSTKDLSINDYLIVKAPAAVYKPGETATILAGSASDIYLIQQVEKPGRTDSTEKMSFNYFNINDGFKSLSFPVREEDRGGFGVMNFFVKDNRFYYDKTVINIPWSNKKLDISFDTWRDKTLPGSKETWTVSIKGEKGQSASAEMLASMYDASLDQFRPHQWSPMNVWPLYTSYNNWQGLQNFTALQSFRFSYTTPAQVVPSKIYDRMKYLFQYRNLYFARGNAGDIMRKNATLNEVVTSAMGVQREAALADSLPSMPSPVTQEQGEQPVTSLEVPAVQPRKNFDETAFFYPELRTDKKGNISFSFTMPEALTRWKFMAMAHSKDLSIGYAEKSLVTQKDLMVIPNAPRFFREGDKIEFSAKIVNMTDHEISGNTEFHLLNAATLNPVDSWFKNITTQKPFTVAASQSSNVIFSIDIPKNFNEAVVYKIVASAGNMSDGEEAFIPVVTNRMLVTETMTLPVRGDGTKHFSFEKLLKSGNSATLTNYGLTVEYTPNPAWYAVQALPYLNDFPYECTEQVFNRYFANALAMHISNATPKIKSIFEKWRTEDTAALMSNLQKNEELKSALLEETPWVLAAKNESQQKKNIALLFDMTNMSRQLDASLKRVKDYQLPNGGFVWFKNGPDDRFMTQYIIADIGHLRQLKAWPENNVTDLNTIAKKGIAYLDARIAEDYENLKKRNVKSDQNNLSPLMVHYLYTRSFFPEIKIDPKAQAAYNYYFSQAKKYWLKQSIYSQGMIALAMYRGGEKALAHDILKSLKENAIVNEELGMYWKAWDQRGYWWYQAPIESQSLMIEAFSEIAYDSKTVSDLKTWLLKNKQTNNWNTTKATAEAVYALLIQGNDLLSGDKNVRITLGKTVFDNKNEKQEAGTGYFKRRIDGAQVQPAMGNITVSVASSGNKTNETLPSWGGVYWQYFEDLDKITFAETPLKLSRKLFIEKNTDRGPVLSPVNNGDKISIGDKVTVRIELRVDRDMEYVHMKDMRASCMEPVNVLSGYKFQNGLGYYESTKDISTNFFFNYLPKGTYVFEYPMFVTHSGDFSNGITTIQCMYAPEFTAHSEGVRVTVK